MSSNCLCLVMTFTNCRAASYVYTLSYCSNKSSAIAEMTLQCVQFRLLLSSAGYTLFYTLFVSNPNFIWHVDNYDKLKPYGLCMNGGIDGFSRKMIWVNTYDTNSDPRVVGGYYMDAVQRLEGCPFIICTDPGTETVTIRDCHSETWTQMELLST